VVHEALAVAGGDAEAPRGLWTEHALPDGLAPLHHRGGLPPTARQQAVEQEVEHVARQVGLIQQLLLCRSGQARDRQGSGT
jgi:hypothetical protein